MENQENTIAAGGATSLGSTTNPEGIWVSLGTTQMIRRQLRLFWEPKPDITIYELALCLPYLLNNILLFEGNDISAPHFRHFIIT